MYINVVYSSMYFGEYPLSFAACMNHCDCVRLLHAYKVSHSKAITSFHIIVMVQVNMNAQDTNGNTVLHMCVIHENLVSTFMIVSINEIVTQEMLRLAIELGASLKVKNKQKLSPLTLAAKLAKNRVRNEKNMRVMILNCRCSLNY